MLCEEADVEDGLWHVELYLFYAKKFMLFLAVAVASGFAIGGLPKLDTF